MNDKDKLYFAKLILAAVMFVSFMAVLGLTACLIKNKKVANSQPQISASPEPTASIINETANWETFVSENYYMAPNILSGFKFPRNWIFQSIDGGNGSYMIFTDLGGRTKEELKKEGFSIVRANKIYKFGEHNGYYYEEFAQDLENVCGFGIELRIGEGYEIKERINTVINEGTNNICREILLFLEKQVSEIKEKK